MGSSLITYDSRNVEIAYGPWHMPMKANGSMWLVTQLATSWSIWVDHFEIFCDYTVAYRYHCVEIVAKAERENKVKKKISFESNYFHHQPESEII